MSHTPRQSSRPSARRRSRLRIALLALCTLLLSQWTLATHACPLIRQAGELLAQAQIAQEMAQAGRDCPGHAQSPTVAPDGHGTAPACVKHCSDDGSVGGSQGAGSAVAPPPQRLWRAALPVDLLADASLPAPGAHDATAPPLIIQFCISLT